MCLFVCVCRIEPRSLNNTIATAIFTEREKQPRQILRIIFVADDGNGRGQQNSNSAVGGGNGEFFALAFPKNGCCSNGCQTVCTKFGIMKKNFRSNLADDS